MEWPKLKNIILVILVMTNLCLFFFVAQREWQQYHFQNQARKDVVAFLASRSITVDPDILPRDRDTLPPLTVVRDLEQEATLAARLLGSDVERQVSGGAVYRYSGQNGSIQFHNDGSFSARFTQGAFPTDNDPAASAAVLLERLDFTGELIKHTDDSLTFRQTWQGAPLFFNQVTLAMQDGFFTAITSGQRLGGTPTEDGTRQALPPASALIQLLHGINELGDVCSSIVGIQPGYAARSALTGVTLLTPVWQVSTDTVVYQLDLVSGAVTRLSE